MNSAKKNVLVIGATSGIGRGLCLEYLKLGCKVAASGRRGDLLETLKQEDPQKVFTYINDVTTATATQLITAAEKEMGGLDIIIICAGFGDINTELSTEVELKTVNVNVYGFTDCAVAAYRYFKKKGGGTLAGISSIASFRGGSDSPSYYASKAYVSNYLEGLRIKSFKEKAGIAVCTIIPGFVDTVLAKGVGEGNQGLFWVAPVPKAAKQIINAIDKKKKRAYITKRWWIIARILKIVPDFIYKHV